MNYPDAGNIPVDIEVTALSHNVAWSLATILNGNFISN